MPAGGLYAIPTTTGHSGHRSGSGGRWDQHTAAPRMLLTPGRPVSFLPRVKSLLAGKHGDHHQALAICWSTDTVVS